MLCYTAAYQKRLHTTNLCRNFECWYMTVQAVPRFTNTHLFTVNSTGLNHLLKSSGHLMIKPLTTPCNLVQPHGSPGLAYWHLTVLIFNVATPKLGLRKYCLCNTSD